MVVIILLLVVFLGDDKDDSKSRSETATAAPLTATPTAPVEVPETSTIKPGFKDRRWGDPPTGMKYIGRCGGLSRCYEPKSAECIELGGETNCGITYHYFRRKLFAVTFDESFVTRGEYRPSLLRDLESQWGPGTSQPGGGKEWRSRDQKRGLTIATWTPKIDSMGGRWESVRIWSDRLERERLKVEADPNSPEMRQLQKEIDEYQREQQRQRDRYKM